MVRLSDVEAAAQRLASQVLETPCLESKTLSQVVGARVFLKFENLQFTASFKERGALDKLASLLESGATVPGVSRPVVAYSRPSAAKIPRCISVSIRPGNTLVTRSAGSSARSASANAASPNLLAA